MKNIISIIVACMMSLAVASCRGGSNSSEADRIAQLEDSINSLNSKILSNTSGEAQATGFPSVTTEASQSNDIDNNSSTSSATGTYEFSDRLNTWVLVVNDDETAYIYNKQGGENVKAYGSWDKFVYEKYNRISLRFSDKHPIVWFPSGEESLSYPQIYDGYIYESISPCKAKNPELRLSIKKNK